MAQTPRRASPEAAGAMQYDALAAIVREKRTATRKKSSRGDAHTR
jgi:hypothetical protein